MVYKISIRVHPAVAKWMKNNFNVIDDAFDITKADNYYVFSSSLQRHKINIPSRISKKYASFTDVKIIIREKDFYYYGWEISPLHQCKISDLLYKDIIKQGCMKAMVEYIIGQIPRDVAMREFLVQQNYEDNELKLTTLRKNYQRKYIDKEEDVRDFFFNIKNFQKKNLCPNCPKYKKR